MKKLIALSSLIVALSTFNACATFTTTVTVLAGTITNVLTLVNGSAFVPNMTFASLSATNGTAIIYDSPTNLFTYTNPGYTNLTYYVTNLITGPITNYYGNTYYLTNLSQITITNNVASSSASYSAYYVSAAANTANVYTGINAYFHYGIWVTNTSATTPCSLVVQYQ